MDLEKVKKVAVIFDFDGTLVDSFTPRKFAHAKVGEFLAKYLQEQGYEANKKILMDLIAQIEKEMNEKKIYDRNFWWKEVLKRYTGKNNIRIPSSILEEASLSYWETVKNRSSIYSGVEDVLSSLRQKGIALGLLSDTDGLNGMKLKRIKKTGLQRFFDVIVVAGEDTKEVKPSTEPFIKVCRLLDVSPKNCVFVGDNPQVDIIGPKKLGMKTVLIGEDDISSKEELIFPDYFIKRERFIEIKKLIPKILNIK